VRVFRFVKELDAFVVTDEFAQLADRIGLTEWHPAVWIGRLFLLDNDYGEHWFDNWDEREARETQVKAMGIDDYDLMIVKPEHFTNEADGPCNPPEIRKAFWTDVLKSLELSYDLLFAKARQQNADMREHWPEGYVADLDERITQITAAMGAR
jgi:hypothetical protein